MGQSSAVNTSSMVSYSSLPFCHFTGVRKHGLYGRSHLGLFFPEGFQEFLAGQSLGYQISQDGFRQLSALIGCKGTDNDGYPGSGGILPLFQIPPGYNIFEEW